MAHTLNTPGRRIAWPSWRSRLVPPLFGPARRHRIVTDGGVLVAAMAAGAAGVASTFLDSAYALRVAIGVPIMLVFLSFPYVLLLAWTLLDVFISSTVTAFSGQNLDTALTVPTLLLMVVSPVGHSFRRMPALAYLLAFLAWVLAGINISPLDTISFLKEWGIRLDSVALGVLVISIVTTRRRFIGIVDAILLISAFVALYGIYGYVTHQHVADSGAGYFRATSIFSNVDAPPLALFLSMTLLLAIYRTFTLCGSRWFALSSALIPVFLLAIGMTFTRAAYIGVPISLIILAFIVPSRGMRLSLLSGVATMAISVIALATIGHVPVLARFSQADVTTANGRVYIWKALLTHFDATAVRGSGLEGARDLLTKAHIGMNGIAYNGLITTSPANLWLSALYDHGIIGVILLALVFIALAASLVKMLRKADGERRVLLAVAIAILVTMLWHNLETEEIWNQKFSMYFWIMMALPFAAYWDSRPSLNVSDQESMSGGMR